MIIDSVIKSLSHITTGIGPLLPFAGGSSAKLMYSPDNIFSSVVFGMAGRPKPSGMFELGPGIPDAPGLTVVIAESK